MRQKEIALEYLKQYGSITSYDGVYKLGIMSFPKRICELERDGYEFERRQEVIVDSHGTKKRITRYVLKE